MAGEISRMAPVGSTEAMLWSRDAAVFAVFCLAELKAEKPGTVAWCTAQNLYNEAVARCLRLMQTFCEI